MKDNRKTYTNQEIKLEGNTVRFDGKFNPDKNELKVYRYYGDIALQEQALQEFAIDNKIGTVVFC